MPDAQLPNDVSELSDAQKSCRGVVALLERELWAGFACGVARLGASAGDAGLSEACRCCCARAAARCNSSSWVAVDLRDDNADDAGSVGRSAFGGRYGGVVRSTSSSSEGRSRRVTGVFSRGTRTRLVPA